MDLTDIYSQRIYILLSIPGKLPKTDNRLQHKTNLNIIRKLEITSCILADHHGMKLKMNSTEFPSAYAYTNS